MRVLECSSNRWIGEEADPGADRGGDGGDPGEPDVRKFLGEDVHASIEAEEEFVTVKSRRSTSGCHSASR